MPDVSIALATHNGEKYLLAQLESLVRQTRLPSELVIADDASIDRTLEIADAFAASAPFPVRILRTTKRLGFSDNFLRAAAACQSELIAFCDQDDVWEPQKIEVMERRFADPQVLLAYHNATLVSARGAPIGRVYRDVGRSRVFEPLTRHPWVVVPGFMQVFRRELLNFTAHQRATFDVNWPSRPLTHDRWFMFLASAFGRVAYVGDALVRYRQHGSNVYGFYPNERAHFDRLAGGIRFIRAAASAAANRAAVLRRIDADVPAAWRERSARGIAHYDEMRRQLDARRLVYTSPTYGARAKALSALVAQGSYGRRGVAGFSWWDLLFDFCLAAPLGRRLRRVLRK